MASKMVRMSQLTTSPLHRSVSMETFMVRVYLGSLSQSAEFISVEAAKTTKAEEIVKVAVEKLRLGKATGYELAETFSSGGQICKERRLETAENPVKIQLLWPRVVNHPALDTSHRTEYMFYLRKRSSGNRNSGTWVELTERSPVDSFLTSFLQQPRNKEYPDLCLLPDLNETTMLENLRSRFHAANIYTYVGSILIAMNPFKFYPIYNPKYVKMYQNRRLGDLPPHIFAIADAAYHTMLQDKVNQCIVISGESGSGKTESTNLLLHHLSALSQRGLHTTGIEQTILGAGPVLEAFGNAKTVHNNNSSRFGKFIQVNYRENGMVQGAVVEKYLLEKSRIVAQAVNERNYHVFYYMLAGASSTEKEQLELSTPQDFFYLNQSNCFTLEGLDGECVDEGQEFTRLRQSMEMVGFSTDTQRRIFSVLAAVLHLGNIQYKKKTDHQHHDAVIIKNVGVIKTISSLLKVKESTLTEALTKRKTMAGGETVIMSYNMVDAVGTRDAMAKCLYGGLFDWIVLQVNHALLAKREHKDHQGQWIGVLDIFGFEDFAVNSFEQFCINFANEHLHYYFNQHIFKFEQEEYLREGIQWKNIEFIDNTFCLDLFAKKPTGLLYLLDEECNFPGATNSTLLAKFHASHQNQPHYEVPQMKENAFSVIHYAGKVKYRVEDFREKNCDLMRHDIMLVLKNSSLAFVRELVGYDPVAVLRWAILRSFFRAYFAFIDAGKRHRRAAVGSKFGAVVRRQGVTQRSGSQHLSMTGDMSGGKKVIIVEKNPNKHASFHGDIHFYLGDEEVDVDPDEDGDDDEEDGLCLHVWQSLQSPLDRVCGAGGPAGDHFVYGDTRVMRRASRVIMKNKSFKPKSRPAKGFRDLKSLKTLTGRSYLGPRSSKGKNKPPSVSAQFNGSLAKLMETLNLANPLFVRCIKSNANKAACIFDDELVLRQLRYTGMLATVRLRQSGYNYRLTFEEFIHQYKALLPRGLVSSKEDVRTFLQQLDLNQENYQIGKTKVFLREAEKLLLDDTLHRAILQRIVNIQRWLKTRLERKRFLRLKAACITLQSHVRCFLAKRQLEQLRLEFYATVLIQKVFRGWRSRRQLCLENNAATTIQKHWKGHSARKLFKQMMTDKLLAIEASPTTCPDFTDIKDILTLADIPPSSPITVADTSIVSDDSHLHPDPADLHSSTSDEGVLTKESSTEEICESQPRHDSEESSGILDDSEPELMTPPALTTSHSHHQTEPLQAWPEDELFSQPLEKAVVTVSSWEPDHKKEKFEIRTPPPHIQSPPAQLRSPPARVYSPPANTQSSPPFRPRAQSGPVDIEGHPPPTPPTASTGTEASVKPKSNLSRKPRRYQRSHRIEIRPAVRRTYSAEVFEGYETEPATVPTKQVSAPLARQESLEDKLHECDRIVSRRLTLPDESPISDLDVEIKPQSPATEDQSDDQTSGSTYVSPFNRAKKQLKNIMGGRKNSRKDSESEEESVAEEGVTSPAIKSLEGSASESPKLPGQVKQAWPAEEQPRERKKSRRKNSKKRRQGATRDREKDKKLEKDSATWSVSSTSQWQYPVDILVKDAVELKQLDQFVFNKLMELSQDGGKRDTVFDVVFKGALKEFHCSIITHTATTNLENKIQFRYRDLMTNFEDVLKARAEQENVNAAFPCTLGINAFRGFLDEFNNKKKNKELPKIEEKKKEKKKKEKDQVYEYLGHKYYSVPTSIPTFCEHCSSLLWMMEKGYVCNICKYTVHKKCCAKSLVRCGGFHKSKGKAEGCVIGAPLDSLVDDNHKVPSVLDRIITAIEINGLYTVGIYRKPGAAGKVRQLTEVINKSKDLSTVDFDDYPIHVLATVMKSFFREMPEPLLTFELYDDFLRATECQDPKERTQSVFAVIEKLPDSNHNVMERLVFHLAKVAQHEAHNRMSPNGLAIIFAPSILRTNRDLPAQESLSHVNKQSCCLQTIIEEQMCKIKATLADIKTLDTAAASATDRLTAVRASMRTTTSPKHGMVRPDSGSDLSSSTTSIVETDEDQDARAEEKLLSEQIRSLHQEKDELTLRLPELVCRHSSSEEDLLSTDDVDSAADDLDTHEEYAVTFDLPAVSPPKNLRHLNKHRVTTPTRRLPSKRPAEDSDESPRMRRQLTSPQLEQIGDEILV